MATKPRCKRPQKARAPDCILRVKMPTKQRCKRPQKARAPDSNVFISPTPEKRGKSIKSSRKIIKERGFQFNIEDTMFTPRIQRLGWVEFCKHPEIANNSLVEEFYANLTEYVAQGEKFYCFVRGTRVRFDAKVINKVYGLPNVEDSFSHAQQRLEPKELIHILCPGGSQWKLNKAGKHTCFPSIDLTKEAKVWLYFISARLLPTLHLSEVTIDRAHLLHLILSQAPINVGKIMEREIFRAGNSDRVSLFFPSLITALCSRAQIPAPSESQLENPLDPINEQFISHMGRKLKISGSKRPSSSQQHPTTTRARSSEDRIALLEARVAKLENVQLYDQNYIERVQLWVAHQLGCRVRNLPIYNPPNGDEDEEEEDEDDDSNF